MVSTMSYAPHTDSNVVIIRLQYTEAKKVK